MIFFQQTLCNAEYFNFSRNPMTGLFLLFLTSAVFVIAAVIALFAFFAGRLDIFANVVKVCLVWAAAYFSLLIGASVSSEPVVLEPGERKMFCGAFLDCHLGVAVTKTWKSRTFSSESSEWISDGDFLFVEIEISNDAGEASLGLHAPRIDLVSADGRRFDRARHLAFELATQLGQPHSLSTPVRPHSTIRKTLVYNVPADVEHEPLRLHATDGHLAERFVELFLIGDEDSLFHRPVLHDLSKPDSRKV